MKPTSATKLDNPVRPLNVPFAKPAIRIGRRFLTALIYGDAHFKDQCDRTLNTVLAIATDLQPDVMIDIGDGVDAGGLSEKFKNDPTKKDTLQDEINAKRIQLAQFRQATPNAKWWYREGNHEERMKRTMWNLEGPAKQLIALDIAQVNLTWPKLLGLDEMHINFTSYAKQVTTDMILPHFLVKHGTIVRTKAGYSARGELEKFHRSGASGHTHRLAAIWKRSHGKQNLWVETGCCCNLDPHYTEHPDWQNGCVVLTFDTKTGAVQPEPLEIRKGTVMFRGQFYK